MSTPCQQCKAQMDYDGAMYSDEFLVCNDCASVIDEAMNKSPRHPSASNANILSLADVAALGSVLVGCNICSRALFNNGGTQFSSLYHPICIPCFDMNAVKWGFQVGLMVGCNLASIDDSYFTRSKVSSRLVKTVITNCYTTEDKPYPTESEMVSLRHVAEGKAWKVELSRLENLINKGWCNAMGSSLTKSGKEVLA